MCAQNVQSSSSRQPNIDEKIWQQQEPEKMKVMVEVKKDLTDINHQGELGKLEVQGKQEDLEFVKQKHQLDLQHQMMQMMQLMQQIQQLQAEGQAKQAQKFQQQIKQMQEQMEKMQQQSADIAAAGISITASRQKNFLFSNFFLLNIFRRHEIF